MFSSLKPRPDTIEELAEYFVQFLPEVALALFVEIQMALWVAVLVPGYHWAAWLGLGCFWLLAANLVVVSKVQQWQAAKKFVRPVEAIWVEDEC